jgi:hypothetical protein
MAALSFQPSAISQPGAICKPRQPLLESSGAMGKPRRPILEFHVAIGGLPVASQTAN